MWPVFQTISWVDSNRNVLNIRTESPIDTYPIVQYRDISNFDVSEKYIHMYSYKVHLG